MLALALIDSLRQPHYSSRALRPRPTGIDGLHAGDDDDSEAMDTAASPPQLIERTLEEQSERGDAAAFGRSAKYDARSPVAYGT